MSFFLEVSKKTANAAILGDMGWTPQTVLQRLAMCRQLCRYGHMSQSRINLHIINWAKQANVNNWIDKVKKEYDTLNLTYLLDFSNQYSKNHIKFVSDVFMAKFREDWSNCLNKIEGIRGIGQNKLRTYRLFKDEYGTEAYVCDLHIKYGNRKALSLLRCGSAPISIETLRFKNGHHVPVEERLCPVCKGEVEDEFHVVMNCEYYKDIRDELYEHAQHFNQLFNNLSNGEKFKYLMSNVDIVKFTAKACRHILLRRNRYLIV